MAERDSLSLRAVARTLVGKPSDWRIRRPTFPSPPRPGASWWGPAVALVTVIVGWWAFVDAVGKEENVAFALFVGSISIMLMSWSNILSTRVRMVETLFGGLDRAYRAHRWFGALAVVAMWLHTQNVDDVKGIRGASRDVAEAAEELADTATTILYVLVAISILRLMPTNWWRITHKFVVVPYAIACWHFYTATKPYSNGSAWGAWFGGWMLLGLAAWTHRVVWRDMIRRGRDHRVVHMGRDGGAITLELEPLGRPLSHRPGQFVFLKSGSRGMGEPHPFTIASAPGEPTLRFVVKNLGDWTSRLDDAVRPGDTVRVEGPYGRLQPMPDRPGVTTLWIAGGVGITPFLGTIPSLPDDADWAPILFYCVRSRDDAPGLSFLERAAMDGRIVLDVRASQEGNRLDVEALRERFGPAGLAGAHVVMCGPDSLVRAMRVAVRDLGARNVHVEGFDIRSGIGPDRSREIDEMVRHRRLPATLRR